jgi:hypothetical protein
MDMHRIRRKPLGAKSLTGTINLRGNPVSLATLAGLIPLGASAKKYVDGAVSGIGSGWLPASGGTITGLASESVAYSYFTPTTGTTVSLTGVPIVVIDPAATIAALTISLPSSPADGLTFIIGFTRQVTSITWANGTIGGTSLTSRVAGGHMHATYLATPGKWFLNG